MAGMVVPPGGFAGMAQMTPASRAAWGTRKSSSTRTRRKRKTAKKRTKRAKSRRASKSPKFGTPAFRKKYGNGKRKRKK